MWTLDELVERARAALAAEYPGAPNGRVRDLPDRRSIRWYAQTGLVDRPAGLRGRTALYGPRHLLQLVALKRRQAGGLTLAQIQAELTGATDAELAEIARVPEALLTAGSTPVDYVFADAAPSRPHFWTTVPAPPGEAAAEMADPPARTGEADEMVDPAVRTGGRRRSGPPARARRPATEDDPAQPVGGVALGGGAILVLPTPVTSADVAAVTAAAGPLMTLLADRGLLNHHFDTGRAS